MNSIIIIFALQALLLVIDCQEGQKKYKILKDFTINEESL